MFRTALALSVITLGLGCGTSLRLDQQSHVYFERCYAADFDPRFPAAEKHACWTAWVEHYQDGQPPERRDYAANRLEGLERGEAMRGLPGIPALALGPQQVTTFTAAAAEGVDIEVASRPENVGETAVAEMGEVITPVERPEAPVEADAPEAQRTEAPRRERRHMRVPLPRTSNQACARVACSPAWVDCVDRCPDTNRECVNACRVELHACSRGCF